jgi:hypothetical protein
VFVARSQYDLNVYGDLNVGGVNIITTSTTDSRFNVYVDGSVAALQVIFTDTELSETEYILLNATWDKETYGEESLSVSFNKYELNSAGDDVSYDLLTVTAGVGVNNELDTNVTSMRPTLMPLFSCSSNRRSRSAPTSPHPCPPSRVCAAQLTARTRT